MQSPSNLEVTALARSLAAALYRSTSTFPDSERFGLTARMRRAAISIGSDISEGCGRNGPRDFARFLHMALGSASELEFQAAALSLPRSAAPPLLRHTKNCGAPKGAAAFRARSRA
ncbi:MAG: four helix bundle protein [Gemmatimonadaceae bacterium]|nr:four helix bundle protein [Gemmatimonadaceae bacterium]